MTQECKIDFRLAELKLNVKFHFGGANREHQGIFLAMGGGP